MGTDYVKISADELHYLREELRELKDLDEYERRLPSVGCQCSMCRR